VGGTRTGPSELGAGLDWGTTGGKGGTELDGGGPLLSGGEVGFAAASDGRAVGPEGDLDDSGALCVGADDEGAVGCGVTRAGGPLGGTD
jgi:hypothetical protein